MKAILLFCTNLIKNFIHSTDSNSYKYTFCFCCFFFIKELLSTGSIFLFLFFVNNFKWIQMVWKPTITFGWYIIIIFIIIIYLRVLFSSFLFLFHFSFHHHLLLKLDWISSIQIKNAKKISLLSLINRHRRLDHLHGKQKEDTWTMKRSYHLLNCHPIPVLNLMHSNWPASAFHWHLDGTVINFGWIWKDTHQFITLSIWFDSNQKLFTQWMKSKTYLSRFFIDKFRSTFSIKLSNQCAIVCCLSSGCDRIILSFIDLFSAKPNEKKNWTGLVSRFIAQSKGTEQMNGIPEVIFIQ